MNVEIVGQDHGRPARCRCDADLRDRVPVLRAHVGETLAVGRPARRPHPEAGVRNPRRVATRRRHHPDVGVLLDVGVHALRQERDARPVRRPRGQTGRRALLIVGQLPGRARRGIDHPHLPALPIVVPRAIRLVRRMAIVPDVGLLVPLARRPTRRMAGGRGLADARQPRPVRRPREGVHAILQVRHPARLSAAIEAKHVHLRSGRGRRRRRVRLGPRREERDPATVGAPLGAPGTLHRRELPGRLAAIRGRDPDARRPAVLLSVDAVDDKRHECSVRGQRGIGQRPQLVEVLWRQSPRSRRGGRDHRQRDDREDEEGGNADASSHHLTSSGGSPLDRSTAFSAASSPDSAASSFASEAASSSDSSAKTA